MPQDPPSEQPRDTRACKIPVRYDNTPRSWSFTTAQCESAAQSSQTSSPDEIHGGFDAIHIVSKTTVPIPMSQRRNSMSSAHMTASSGDSGVDRSPGLSPSNLMHSFTSLPSYAHRNIYPQEKSLPSPPPSGEMKRQISSEPSPLSQSSKRRKLLSRPVLPHEDADIIQAKMAPVGPICQSGKQGLWISPALAKGSAMDLSRTGPTSGEKTAKDCLAVRQFVRAGLGINTDATKSGTPPKRRDVTTSGEKLHADYVTHVEALGRELDSVAHELNAANKRANKAELRAQKAESMAYQANIEHFGELKVQGDKSRKEIARYRQDYKDLKSRYDALQLSIDRKDQAIDELKRILEQGLQMFATVASEQAPSTEKLRNGPVIQ